MKTTKNTSRQPKLNVHLLRRIKRHILEEPRRFFMEGIVVTGIPGQPFINVLAYDDLPELVPACGTAACIHGWTALLSGKTPKQTKKLRLKWSARKLGLPSSVARDDSLFIADYWPQPYRRQYNNACTSLKRAKIAAARIEHLITTGV